MQVHMGIFVIYLSDSSHSVFSPFWTENILVGLKRKHLNPINFFPSPSSNQTLTKKVFLPIFYSKFFIHPISPPNKHTLTNSNQATTTHYLAKSIHNPFQNQLNEKTQELTMTIYIYILYLNYVKDKLFIEFHILTKI